jgi:hypothetical protein
MADLRRLVVVPAALICIAGGCAKFLGIESHSLAPDGGGAGAGGAAGTLSGSAGSVAGAAGGSSGSDAGTVSDSRYVSDGEPQGGSGCVVDGGVSDAGAMDAGVAMACGFTMPNPANAGLPNPASYTEDLVKGTVYDNVTGLTWEAAVNPNAQFTRTQAIKHCQDQGLRLPTRIELVSLVDFTKPGVPFMGVDSGNPTIDPRFNPTPAQRFWTSSIFTCNPNAPYYVSFDYGSTHPAMGSDLLYFARCVSGGPSRCVPKRYDVQSDGVHDLVTGLTWQRDVSPKQFWSDAMTTCSTRGAGWRLPSLTELQTIVDETKHDPPIDGVVFPQTPAGLFWTSSPQAGHPNFAWYVAFLHGHADTDDASSSPTTGNTFFVRCVH